MFECREKRLIVAASFNAGMTMAAFILTVAVKEVMSSMPVQPAGLLG